LSKNKPNGNFVLGLMSGTSLDGLDLALCEFEPEELGYKYIVHKVLTVPYDVLWKKKLSEAQGLSAEAYFTLNSEYGRFMAEKVNDFLMDSSQKPDFIASHGHTVFHQTQKGFSTQLGCGATLAALTGISTVCDFRNLDVALGGQGAPLVPVGDKLLFSNHQACVNIGGIANISFDNSEGKRVAFDICEANMLLNHLSEKLGKAYDEDGLVARTGKIEPGLLSDLNALEFYKSEGAKSMGREWFEHNVLPLIKASSAPIEDVLNTSVEHIAITIAQTLNKHHIKAALFSGGGALNGFLMDRIRHHSSTKCNVADSLLVNFKEALIFAFLGYLRVHDVTNTLSSVTGARTNSIGGAIYSIKK